jgi:tetratricopeptide (TPR) repeat protein
MVEDPFSPTPARRWNIPPALLREPGETLEGTAILEEFSSLRGLLLWLAFRDVLLWAQADPEARGGLFAPGAAQCRRQLGSLLLDRHIDTTASPLAVIEHPATTQPGEVAEACVHIAGWAEAHGAPRTALAFTQAAALVQPESGAAALTTGEAAARAGQTVRARTWLRRAIAVARRSREGEVSARAYLTLSRLLREDGRRDEARANAYKAARAARRYGASHVRALAVHELSQLAREEGRDEQADRLAAIALRAYGRDDPGRPRVMIDVARSWVDRREPRRALPWLERALNSTSEPGPLTEGLALLARVAAALGDRGEFEAAWSRAWHLIRHLPEGMVPEGVHEDLGVAAEALGDAERLRRVEAPRAGEDLP